MTHYLRSVTLHPCHRIHLHPNPLRSNPQLFHLCQFLQTYESSKDTSAINMFAEPAIPIFNLTYDDFFCGNNPID